jgi:carboxypeptidase family protein
MQSTRQFMGLGSLGGSPDARVQMSLNHSHSRTVAVALGQVALACLFIPSGWVAAVTSPRGVSNAKTAAVRGVVWNADNSPVPNGRVRLRNLHTGRVEATALTTDQGQFTFHGIEGGSYVSELVSDSGKVIAVGQGFRVEAGETVGTFVRLSARQPWLTGVFSNTAAAVISAASSAGVTAIGSHAPPVSPQ